MKWSLSKVSSSSLHEDTGDLPEHGQHSALHFYFRSRLLELAGAVDRLTYCLPGSGPEWGQAGCDPTQISLRLCWQAGEETELGELFSARVVCFLLFRFSDPGTLVDWLLPCQLWEEPRVVCLLVFGLLFWIRRWSPLFWTWVFPIPSHLESGLQMSRPPS